MTDTITQFFYPNKMGRIILSSLEEVMGKSGLRAVLSQAELEHWIDQLPPDNLNLEFSFDDISALQFGLERLYGPRGGRGLALRTGRAAFKYGLRDFGPMMGFTDLAFRLAPLENKLRWGAELFADIFNHYTDQKVLVEVRADHILWHIQRCPICWNRESDTPVCHLAVGLLQEALYWVSGGKIFRIEETHCIARGDPTCTIRIEKQVLD